MENLQKLLALSAHAHMLPNFYASQNDYCQLEQHLVCQLLFDENQT